MSDPASGTDMPGFLRDAFEANYERLRVESGRGLSADGRQFAWKQALLYWLKLEAVARSVTDTEVLLALPNQRTPKGRPYAIEGVVDIVREVGYTVMYDIKSHDAEYIRKNRGMYKQQLDVYAYIWQALRAERLNRTAIIATEFPQSLADALESGDEGQFAYEMAQWNPLIEMHTDASAVHETVEGFGAIVDAIEDGEFAPRSVADLEQRQGAKQERFATAVCRNCDARFSCSSYREWVASTDSRIGRIARHYFEDVVPEERLEDVRTANLDAAHSLEELAEDFS